VSGCIIHPNAPTAGGYRRVRVGGRRTAAHRLAYCEAHSLSLDEIDGFVVRHRCDNPGCVNPDHLELGTQADNVRDRDERGRTSRGASHYSAKLTEVDVLAIRSDSCPYSLENQKKYGISDSAIWRIVSRRTWKNT